MKTRNLLSGVLFLGCVAFSISYSAAQDLPLEKILNPLPEYNPFDQSTAPTPQFFPDQVDKRARDLLIDALINDEQALNRHLQFFKAEDERLKKERGTSTGLTAQAQDLVNNTIRERERYLAAQKEALKNATTPERKKYLEALINNDDLNQSDQLMRQSSTNFWGGMTNRMLSSVDLVGVASGNYIGAVAETAVSQLYGLMDRDMPIEERRALARDLDHLKRFPDDPRNGAIKKQAEQLDKKKKAALVRKQIDRAKEALAKNDLDRALFHLDLAALIEPESKDATELRGKVTKAMSEMDVARQKSLVARAESPASDEQRADVDRLLEALSLRDSNQLQRVAIDTEKKYLGTSLADAARDSEAVALDMKGWREAAKKALQQMANSTHNPEVKQRANALLQSPEYNLLEPFQEARTERQLQSAKYVLLGEDFLRKNLLFAAGAMAAAGPGAAISLGMANALIITNNFYQVVTHNPVSAQPVIDAGVAYVRNHPDSENASEVYRVLADAYEERGMIDQAINYHQLAGSSKEKIAALKEKSAKMLLDAAAKSSNRSSREYYLTTVIDEHPETPAAREATRRLADLVKNDNQGLRMSKQFLIENPELYGPRGLGLKPALFDGRSENMEIAERGVNLISDNEILVHYKTPWGERSQNYSLPKSTSERFFITLREKNLQVALADVNQRAKDSVGGIKNLPASIVKAEHERRPGSAEEAADNTFTLVREVGGSAADYQKVLDFQLLSDNERDPGGKYKLPPIEGSISASRFSMSGALPAGVWGNQLAVGSDRKSPYAGFQLPIPLIDGFIPIDFMIQGRPGGISLYPRVHTGGDTGADPELYRDK